MNGSHFPESRQKSQETALSRRKGELADPPGCFLYKCLDFEGKPPDWKWFQPAKRFVMIDDVYNAKILSFAGNIGRVGRLDAPDATATGHSKLCGSTITVDLRMDGDTVTDFAHVVKACALGQASSSVMAQHVVGATAEELRTVRDEMQRMLKENGPPPSGERFADLKYLEPVRDYKARHASTMLTFDAVVDAIDQIRRKREGEAA